jgi:hypothetical protein
VGSVLTSGTLAVSLASFDTSDCISTLVISQIIFLDYFTSCDDPRRSLIANSANCFPCWRPLTSGSSFAASVQTTRLGLLLKISSASQSYIMTLIISTFLRLLCIRFYLLFHAGLISLPVCITASPPPPCRIQVAAFLADHHFPPCHTSNHPDNLQALSSF